MHLPTYEDVVSAAKRLTGSVSWGYQRDPCTFREGAKSGRVGVFLRQPCAGGRCCCSGRGDFRHGVHAG
jgi:hypothetical protein